MDEQIAALLADAMRAIDASGELPIDWRRAVRRALLERGQAWPRVEIEAVRRVLSVWAAHYPATGPIDLLATTEAFLAGSADRGRLEDAANRLESLVQDIDTHDDDELSLVTSVGWAATRAAWSAFAAEFDEASMDADPWEWTASFGASMVDAGGAVWDNRGDPARRRAFWEWWLEEAVPAALLGDA
ncbi:MAG TPA: Imm5 family immunity protein [Candidatus Limnocylindrales bacterium]|nr:Imm5 family immunity protein [Candidatus Limnocylindrales bacterium]